MTKYKVAGVMSGTSLDGLDIAVCEFSKKGKRWHYQILQATTVNYQSTWKKKLAEAHLLSAGDLLELNAQYGQFIGRCCKDFFASRRIRDVDFIASHGHTIFHQPASGFTYQLGDGSSLHAVSGLPVVFDFRTLDVQLGGQGAPLVPVGDHYLFGDYDVCLNIGGIANVSMLRAGKRVAFDVCFANMALNYLALKKGKEFDKDGKLAAAGTIDQPTLKNLRAIYQPLRKSRPSLAREGFEKNVLPLLERSSLRVEDLLATVCESIACEIAECLPASRRKLKLMATGGGALNKFLMDLIQRQIPQVNVVVPDTATIKFKEALVFAFLGVLRVRGEVNVFRSATGASRDSSAGVMAGFTVK